MTQSIMHIKRQVSRAKATATAALDAPDGQWVPLKTMASDVLTSAAAFESADSEVRKLEAQSKKEVEEALQALTPLAQVYDTVRTVANAKLGATRAGSSTR